MLFRSVATRELFECLFPDPLINIIAHALIRGPRAHDDGGVELRKFFIHLAEGDEVTVHYVGSLIDGTVFDSSRSRGTPATLPLHGVIACWTTALQAMKVGGRSRIVCPPELAYGERGAPPTIKPGATLVFDIELLAIAR